MIISHEYKFIFIKTAKTAGTSIEVFLSQFCGKLDILTPIYPQVEGHIPRNYLGFFNPFPEFIYGRGSAKTINQLLTRRKYWNHIDAQSVKCRTSPSIWNSYFKFCVERNPWDKTMSHYYMVNDRLGGDMSFDDYLKKGKLCVNYPRYMGQDGNILVDKIIKYENLSDGLSNVFSSLSIPFSGDLGVRAKSEHRKNNKPYQDFYSHKQKVLVEKAFEKEIEISDYTF